MKKFKQIIVGTFIAFLALDVTALPSISGSLDMFGAAPAVYDVDGNLTGDASTAASVVFDPDQFLVVDATVDFSSVNGMVGIIQDLTFAPFAGPIADFWTVGSFSFELSSVVRDTSNDPTSILVLNGTGIISDSSLTFAATDATWSFSTDTSGNSQFSWNAVSEAVASVPEPSALMLFAIGLVGFGLRKRV